MTICIQQPMIEKFKVIKARKKIDFGIARKAVKAGEMVLLVLPPTTIRPKFAVCFRRQVVAGEDVGYLMHSNDRFLVAFARKLGIKRIKIDKLGSPDQHINLCGQSLENALARMQWMESDK